MLDKGQRATAVVELLRHSSSKLTIPEGAGGFNPLKMGKICAAFRPGHVSHSESLKEMQLSC
jgi:hypothetical protein